jgi:hypothetical protein
MGCIYRIVCGETGRSYVGQTSFSHPFYRFKEHQRDARNGRDGLLYDDMRYYGVEAFECICICVAANECLNSLECYYAEQYDAYSWMGGYNVAECGGEPLRDEMSDAKRLRIKRNAIWRNLHRK